MNRRFKFALIETIPTAGIFLIADVDGWRAAGLLVCVVALSVLSWIEGGRR